MKKKAWLALILIVLTLLPNINTFGAGGVVYNANGGLFGNYETRFSALPVITSDTPAYPSNIYEFKGWTVEKYGTPVSAYTTKEVEVYKAGESIPDGVKTLYAAWDLPKVDITKRYTITQKFIDIDTMQPFMADDVYTITAGSCVHAVQPPYYMNPQRTIVYNILEWTARVDSRVGEVVAMPDYIPHGDCALYCFFHRGELGSEEIKKNDVIVSGDLVIEYYGNLATSGSMEPDSVPFEYGYVVGREPVLEVDFTIKPCAYKRDGYVFTGWKYERHKQDGSVITHVYQPGDIVTMGTTDMRRYHIAYFTKDYSGRHFEGIRFNYLDDDDRVYKTEWQISELDSAGKVISTTTVPTDPTNCNYYYIDDENIYVKRDMLAKMTLTAQWTEDPRIITYDYNFDYGAQGYPTDKGDLGRLYVSGRAYEKADGTTGYLAADQRIVGVGSAIGTMPFPTRDGYIFKNWSLSEDTQGNGKIAAVTPETEYIWHGDRTFYARWEPAEVEIVLDYNGSRTNVSTYRTFLTQYGTLPEPRWEGYEFKGWHYGDENGAEVKETDIVSTPYRHTLVAKWEPVKVKVVYMTMGGDPIPDGEAEYGQPLGDAVRFVYARKTGYVFDEWNRKPDGKGEKVTGDTVCDSLDTIVLYAQYHGHLYDVTLDYCTDYKRAAVNFSKNGLDKYKAEYGALYPQLPVPTREGYVFLGWATQKGADGNGQALGFVGGVDMGQYVQLGDKTILTCDTPMNHTLYAVWEAIKVKIIFDDNKNYISPMDFNQY